MRADVWQHWHFWCRICSLAHLALFGEENQAELYTLNKSDLQVCKMLQKFALGKTEYEWHFGIVDWKLEGEFGFCENF